MGKVVHLKRGQKAVDETLISSACPPAIKLACAENVRDILDLETACFNPHKYDLMDERALRYFLGPANGFILIVEESGHLAGYGQVMFRKNSSAGRFCSLAVHPDFQGKGVGGRLFKAIEDVCRALDADTLLLEIRQDNDVLKSKYSAMGYKPYQVIADYYPDHVPSVKMKRKL